MKRTGLFIIIFFLAMSVENYSTEITPSDYFSRKVVEKRLDNGIVLLMIDRGFSPTLALHVTFRVGSVDESYNTEGAAHILEHMLFKGTDRLGTRDYIKEKPLLDRIGAVGESLDRLRLENPRSSEIKRLEGELAELQKEHAKLVIGSPYDMLYTSNGGVMFNASTSKDMTGYYIQLPTEKLKLWAETESERLRKPVFREYYRERNNVYEERLMRVDSGGDGLLNEAFYAEAFSAHPYRHPIIGWESNIKYMSLQDVKKFYNEYYIPSRMTITIVGKQDTEKTYSIVKDYFGKLKSKPEPGEVKIIEPEQKGEKRITVNFKSRPSIIIGWKKPGPPSDADFAFDIMQTALGGGKTSRLYKALVLDRRIASSVYAWNGAPGSRYDNLFVIYASPVENVSVEELEQAIYSEMSRFRNEISEEELKKVKNISESSFIFMLDSNSSIARTLSYYQAALRDWRYISGYTERLNSVTVEDVKKTYDRYIRESYRTVALLKDSRSGK